MTRVNIFWVNPWRSVDCVYELEQQFTRVTHLVIDLMKSFLRGSRLNVGVSQRIYSRSLNTTTEQTVSKPPLQVGSVHYQEGDRVIVINKDGGRVKRVKRTLLSPLKPETSTITGHHAYEIQHSDIIGKPAGRLYVNAPTTNSKGKGRGSTYRVSHPSLEEFVSLAPRTVTPIYSSYGATIVTLLDFHVAPPQPSNGPKSSSIAPLEILEAGTGNGGLTLHLARAIAAANPPPPHFESDPGEEQLQEAWQKWRTTRRAVVHTVEFQKMRSNLAEKLIRSFRGALYWPHIDFHSGDVGKWAKEEHERRQQDSGATAGFLDVVILDLPAVHRQIEHVVNAMKEDAQLVVWVPQITQVAACQREIESLQLPLKLDQVVELGEGISNGRRWDMRFVTPRAELKKEQDVSEADSEESGAASDVAEVEVEAPVEDEARRSASEFPVMVCRPMVGELVMGGGFVGLWRKVSKVKAERQNE